MSSEVRQVVDTEAADPSLAGRAGQRLLVLLTLELVVWIGLALLTLLVALGTLTSEFPARFAALLGEGVVLMISAALAGWALHCRRRVEQSDERSLSHGLRGAMAVTRVVVGVPVLGFALVVAAAGYSA